MIRLSVGFGGGIFGELAFIGYGTRAASPEADREAATAMQAALGAEG